MCSTDYVHLKRVLLRYRLHLPYIKMHIHQLDVSNAFCYANIEGDVYAIYSPLCVTIGSLLQIT